MASLQERLHERIALLGGPPGNDMSRATSPDGSWQETNGGVNEFDSERQGRNRPRTFPYATYLPYETEDEGEKQKNLDVIMENLFIAVSAGDFTPGAVHWTREIRGWLSLKFDLSRQQRLKLVKLYYELALAPGLDISVSERFASMFMVLTKQVENDAHWLAQGLILRRRKHYLRPGKDLTLDWRPLYKELKVFVLPSESAAVLSFSNKRNPRTITKM
ncbi:Proteasome activator BLM10, partial [Cryomyces antarcticus]